MSFPLAQCQLPGGADSASLEVQAPFREMCTDLLRVSLQSSFSLCTAERGGSPQPSSPKPRTASSELDLHRMTVDVAVVATFAALLCRAQEQEPRRGRQVYLP